MVALPFWKLRNLFCDQLMARWPRHFWTTVFTYGVMFVLFPILCYLAYAWVRGWLF